MEQIPKNKEVMKLIIVAVGAVLILGGFILYLSLPLLTGNKVVLATQPVDPFDPLRGQYITINYEISSIPSIEGAKEGDRVYIGLQEKDGIWRYARASLSPITDKQTIVGKIKYIVGENMRLEYGIEQYFFERHAELPRNNITVEVKISSDGQARISQLLHNGKPAEISFRNVSLTS